ncbi:MAG: response regulator [Cyanobacteria bacterium J06623_5]
MEEKEREIRLQFLDEAAEYLDTLETTLLGVAQRGVDNQEMNAALRAAHSIKGGAALMGYGLTSELAHRLEDSLKVVKIQRGDGVTSDVEGQLLSGVDVIRQIVERDRTSTPIDESWVANQVTPVFDQLYETLGEPSTEDAASIIDTDEGQDVLPLIFQTEVEGSLERLESFLDEPPIDFQEELVVMAQELSSLGEMLDVPPFIQLCQSVERFAAGTANAEQLAEVGQKALQAWRRAQALVITGNADSMPSELSGISFGLIDFEFEDDQLAQASDAPFATDPFATFDSGDLGAENDALVGDVFAGLADENDALVEDVFARTGDQENAEERFTDLGTPDEALVEDVFAGFGEPEEALTGDDAAVADEATPEADAFAGVFDDEEALTRESDRTTGTEFRFSEAPKPQTDQADLADNTVRVSVRKLNDLNDYFGELTIERNRLEAEVKRMRGLVKDLSRKLRSLDEINDDVRDLYEQPSGNQYLLTGSRNGTASPSQALPPPQPDVSASSSQSHAFSDPEFRRGFDTLEFDRYNDAHLPFRKIVESVVKLQEVADDIELSVDKTEQTTRVIHRTARHLQRNLNQLRMRPLSDITNRFPRALRELEIEHGKSVALTLEGENTLIDRNILEALSDPLMHIVRNAFDHGIETPKKREEQGKNGQGSIAIRAFNRTNRTVITVSDDGNGISLEKIRDRAQSMGLDAELLSAASEAELLSLIFEPGFTTSEKVTALSGRGVGMDVVRNNLTQTRGDISVDTAAGKGTTFTISVPYTLSVTRVMLAEGNRMPVALPTDMIEEVALIEAADMFETDGKAMFHFKGDAVRLIKLSNWLAFNCPRQIDSLEETPNMDRPSVLMFRMGEQRMGLQVDRSWGEQEVAVRRVEGPIALPAGFSNCTILGDGRVVPLISLPDLARWVLSCEGSDINSAEALYSNPVVNGGIDPVSLQTVPEKEVKRRSRFLVIDDSVNVRRLLALTLEKVGYEVFQARDGQDALEKLETGVEIDGIVCDVEMPRMDGYSFLSKLRAQPKFAKIPVTMLTSRSGEKHRTLAMNLGATAYFSKPYQERELLKSLAESLAAYIEEESEVAVS